MNKLIKSLEHAIDQKNWYAAVIVAITLPDICGKIEYSTESSGTRYKKWCEKYLEPKYTHAVGTPQMGRIHKFLSGSDCYALRCALLHEGSDDITEQRARESIGRFHFIFPPDSGSIHCNKKNAVLQLQVDKFSIDIIESIREWLHDIEDDAEKRDKLDSLLNIYDTFAF